MKIIRKGGPWSSQLECMCNDNSPKSGCRCQSLLLVEEGDIKIQWKDDPRPTDVTNQFYFTCPVCLHLTFIDYDKLPEHVREATYARDKAQLEQERAFKAAGE